MSIKRKIKAVALTISSIAMAYVVFAGVRAIASPDPVSASSYTCPEGQTPIGGGECRIEVTGCPYADSIPKDSPKCVPPVDHSNDTQSSSNAPAQAVPVNKCTGGK